MKHLNPVFILVLTLCNLMLSAQITITSDNVVALGSQVTQAYDTSGFSLDVVGDAGANVSWNFDFLNEHELSTLQFLATSETPFANDFPNSNIAAWQDSFSYTFLNKTAAKLENVGLAGELLPDSFLVAHFTDGESIIEFPASYQGAYTDESRLVIELPFDDPNTPLFDSLRLVRSAILEVDIDGYGELTTPVGSYSTLRFRQDVYSTDSIYFHTPVGWQPVPNGATRDTTSNYSWWTNDNGLGFPLVTVGADSDGSVEEISWLKAFVSNTDEPGIVPFAFTVFPNPASDVANITFDTPQKGTLNIIDFKGKVVHSQTVNGQNQQLSLADLPQGHYAVIFRNEKNRISAFRQIEILR